MGISRTSTSLFTLALIATLTLLMLSACSSDNNSSDDEYPIRPTDELVGIGEPLYQQHCYSCHGDSETPPLVAIAPPHTDDGHTWHHADRDLVNWILNGVPFSQVMPQFRDQLSEQEARAVLAYIKTFWSAESLDRQIQTTQQDEASR